MGKKVLINSDTIDFFIFLTCFFSRLVFLSMAEMCGDTFPTMGRGGRGTTRNTRHGTSLSWTVKKRKKGRQNSTPRNE